MDFDPRTPPPPVPLYKQQGWTIVYPDGSSEDHPVVGRVGGYAVYFGDNRDTATYVPPDEEQTNIWGELRASLRALEGCKPDEHILVCPDCQLMVNGMLGWAQKWRRQRWATTKGPVQHRDLWELLLQLTESLGKRVKWLTPLHTLRYLGTPGRTT